MRPPSDFPRVRPQIKKRTRVALIALAVIIILVLISLKSVATLVTDSMWFSSEHLHRVWSTVIEIKVELFAAFGAIFFVFLWANLAICDRVSPGPSVFDPDDEVVRRYQQYVRPHARKIYIGVSILIAAIAASTTISQWNNWLLFSHGGSFGLKDPQFHWDIGFFVFKLPFYSFLVDWTIVALFVTIVVTAIFHYVNGGIRPQKASARVHPAVKVHLSVLLALVAIVKALGYFLQRYQLDTSNNGYTQGAGYTDVHARLPALEILIIVSVIVAAILLYNIRRRGWVLPIIGVGIWLFVALVVGVIYPALLQALKVNPAQSTLEKPYIQRNITATRAAYGLTNVKVSKFSGASSVTPTTANANKTTLGNIRLWDPTPQISQTTINKVQSLHSYYTFQSVGMDRYTVGGKLQPSIVGVRQINPTDIPTPSWVNTHLEYTHGEGLVVAKANEAKTTGQPVFSISGIPETAASGYPDVSTKNAGVYFGLDDPGYVVANSRQDEFDYQKSTGADETSHYTGTGGVGIGTFFTKALFAVREGDLNLLFSNLITTKSRIMFVRTVVAMAQKAAPFLSFDTDPYAAIVNGQIDWILDAYTTTSNYPYSQNANTQQVPPSTGIPGTGLPGSYNYIRNSVKVVINAYNGQMKFYAMDTDPILKAYESAFPGMFTPKAEMTTALVSHLRYPENLFSTQAAIFGRYHIATATNFYSAGNAWSISPTTGSGTPTNTIAVTKTTNAQGIQVSSSLSRMSPQYQVLNEPGVPGQSFTISDAYVPAGQSGTTQVLSAFMMGNSNPGHYGQLQVFETPPGTSVVGPLQADSFMEQSPTVSKQITLYNKTGSHVSLGNILTIPIGGSILYVRPLYLSSKSNPIPDLKFVISVFGQHVGIASTLATSLSQVLGVKVSSNTVPTLPPTTVLTTSPVTATTQKVGSYLSQASTDYSNAEAALKAGTLGTYQKDVTAMDQAVATAKKLLSTTAPAKT